VIGLSDLPSTASDEEQNQKKQDTAPRGYGMSMDTGMNCMHGSGHAGQHPATFQVLPPHDNAYLLGPEQQWRELYMRSAAVIQHVFALFHADD